MSGASIITAFFADSLAPIVLSFKFVSALLVDKLFESDPTPSFSTDNKSIEESCTV